jgi:hypothetical protein
VPGDFVILRHGAGKYSYGRVGHPHPDGACPVEVAGRGVILARIKQCMLVAALVRQGALQEIRACAENPQH